MLYALILLLSVSLGACVSNTSIPPAEQTFKKSQTFFVPYEAIWLHAVDWFADNNVEIEKIEKSPGLLTAKYVIGTNDTLLDCGRIMLRGAYNKRVERYGVLNVTVRALSESQTRVTVNFFGKYKAFAHDVFTWTPVSATGICSSTGRLEGSVFDYIESVSGGDGA